MRASALREALGLVGLLAASCGGKIEATADGGAKATTTPAEDADECPHEVELRGFDVTLSPERACTLAAAAPGCFGSYCQPARSDCRAACGDPNVTACALPVDYVSAFKKLRQQDGGFLCPDPGSGALTLHCAVTELRGTRKSGCPVEGRRPSGLVAGDAHDETLGAYFAECAWLEAASVDAFGELGAELARLDAPRALVDACIAAADDERRHAATMGALARRHGGSARPVERAAPPARGAFALAIENAVEGVVREAFGAGVAVFRGARAADPDVRRAMAEIAPDEERHAGLALAIAAFLETRLDVEQRAAVARAKRDAARELRATFADDPPARLRAVAGVPSAAEARAILAIVGDALGWAA